MHNRCQKKSKNGWIPTRLVDIKEFQNSGRIRVVCRDEVLLEQTGGQIRYLTLSHVWGDDKFLTLTATNIQHLGSGCHISRLPKTFRDAIAVTSHIGLRYLWIDSLWYVYS
jgi:Heterokaryon incompatibility protein (HET)